MFSHLRINPKLKVRLSFFSVGLEFQKFCPEMWVKMIIEQNTGQLYPGQWSPIKDYPRNLPITFGQNRGSNEQNIVDRVLFLMWCIVIFE